MYSPITWSNGPASGVRARSHRSHEHRKVNPYHVVGEIMTLRVYPQDLI